MGVEKDYFEMVDQWVANDLWEDWETSYVLMGSDEKKQLVNASADDKISAETLTKIINSITLENVGYSGRYDCTPILTKGNKIIDILRIGNLNVFDPICDRIKGMSFDDDEIPLIVFLVELLSINVRDEYDYYMSNRLDFQFRKRLSNFVQSADNPKLAVIVWAVYMETKVGSKSALKSTFPLLPTYLQIKCVRKLFQLMELGKIPRSIDYLYQVIGGVENNLCIPLEVSFRYLNMKILFPNNKIDNDMMLSILSNRKDHADWKNIDKLIPSCFGRISIKERDRKSWKSYRDYTNGAIHSMKEGDKEILRLEFSRKMIDPSGEETKYNNRHYNNIIEFISLNVTPIKATFNSEKQKWVYFFSKDKEYLVRSMAKRYDLTVDQEWDDLEYHINKKELYFCEGRRSLITDKVYDQYFYWCKNYPCFRPPIVYQESSRWMNYSLLDFMRILGISTDYVKKDGSTIPLGHYTILASYFQRFSEYYKHLICRKCKTFLQPKQLSNYGFKAVNTFFCDTIGCEENKKDVYLNRCFSLECGNSIIDSRDTQKCPNGQYICKSCGSCCSTKSFQRRVDNLDTTGGYISKRISNYVSMNQGHLEQNRAFCYQCGSEMQRLDVKFVCEKCKVSYYRPKNSTNEEATNMVE